MLPAQKHVQQNAERVDVGGGRDSPSGELFRSRVQRRQGPSAVAGRRDRAPALAFRLGSHELRDPEVQQLHAVRRGGSIGIVGANQDVRRLDVAVDDEMRVRVRDGRQHAEKQTDPGRHVQVTVVAVQIDVLALHVLQNEVRLAARRDAGVDQMRNRRVGEPREDRPLADEAFFTASPDQRGIEHLDCGAPLEPSIAPVGEPDGAHAAGPDARVDRVGADRLPLE
jgi:hypothetical protein